MRYPRVGRLDGHEEGYGVVQASIGWVYGLQRSFSRGSDRAGRKRSTSGGNRMPALRIK